jgi:hypothetical protein
VTEIEATLANTTSYLAGVAARTGDANAVGIAALKYKEHLKRPVTAAGSLQKLANETPNIWKGEDDGAAKAFRNEAEQISKRANAVPGTLIQRMSDELMVAAEGLLEAGAKAEELVWRFEYAAKCYRAMPANAVVEGQYLPQHVEQRCQWWRDQGARVEATLASTLNGVAERLEKAAADSGVTPSPATKPATVPGQGATPPPARPEPHEVATGKKPSGHGSGAPGPAAPAKPAAPVLPDIKPQDRVEINLAPAPSLKDLQPPTFVAQADPPPPPPPGYVPAPPTPSFARTDVPLPDIAQDKLTVQDKLPPQPPTPTPTPANTSVVEFPIVTAPKDPPTLPTVKVENPVLGYVTPPAPLPTPTMPFTADEPSPPPPPPPSGTQPEVDNRLVAQTLSSGIQPSALYPTVFGSHSGWAEPAPTTVSGGEADRVTVTATDRNRDGTFDHFTTDGAKNVTVKVDGHTV